MVFALARETGWTEYFILWELPAARALLYYHATLRSHDVWTVPPGEGDKQITRGEASGMEARLRAFAKAQAELDDDE